jgi:Ser/Thr protein kinase RdoA (MazF antagonist)
MSRIDRPDDEWLRFADGETRQAREVLATFLPSVAGATIRRLESGFSGARVFRCEVAGTEYALKRWPAATKAARVDEVHEVIRRARNTLSVIPELIPALLGQTRLSWDSHHYELARWMPGGPADDSAERLRAVERGAAVIAGFHDSTRCWGETDSPPAAVLRRLSRIEELRQRLPQAVARQQAPTPTLARATAWLRLHGQHWLEEAARLLGPWATRLVPTQIVLRDIHRHHILFDDGTPSGLVDFDALGNDTIATDLARWVSGFLGPGETTAGLEPNTTHLPAEETVWRAAWAGYHQRGTISEQECELAMTIAQASWIIQLANWVVWTQLGERDFSDCWPAVDRRVEEIMLKMKVNLLGTAIFD